jgi:RNA polymerase sigma factor (sigma-70 family)
MIMEKEVQRKSVDHFFRVEYRKLVNFVRKNLESRFIEASPEDIVQDVALGLVNRLDVDVQVENIAAYIYRAIRNRIIDFQKKKERNISIETFSDKTNGNYLSNTLADETDIEDAGYASIEPETLKLAIGQLRPDEQALILATEFEERTFEELSDEWDIPLGTLLSRKHRALSKLQKILIQQKNR